MRDDLRPHGHTKSGDGGAIEGIEVDSDGNATVTAGPTELASGTVEIGSSGETTVSTGVTSEAGIYESYIGVSNSGSGLGDYADDGSIVETRDPNPTGGADRVEYQKQWNPTAGEWEIYINSGIDSVTQFQWKMVEL